MQTMVIHVQKFQVYALLAIETIETDTSPIVSLVMLFLVLSSEM